MAIRTTAAIPAQHTTDAEFRAYVSEIIAAIIAMGWVQTADTGQINTATVLRPTTVDTLMGFAMFRMADALQATSPVFMKVSFGSLDAAALPAIQLEFATSTNGTGGLTGLKSDIYTFGPQAAAATGTIYTSGSTSRLSMVLWGDLTPATASVFNVERTKDSAGVDTGDGLLICVKGSRLWAATYANALCSYQMFNFTPGAAQGSTAPRSWHDGTPCFAHGNGQVGSGAVGAHTPVFPWRIPSQRGAENEPMNILAYYAALIPGNFTEFDAEMYGVLRHFKGFTTLGASVFYGGGAAPYALVLQTGANAIRWE